MRKLIRRYVCALTSTCLDWVNLLQSIPTAEHGHLFVTMNPPFEPEESKVIARHKYDHAVVDVHVRQNTVNPSVF